MALNFRTICRVYNCMNWLCFVETVHIRICPKRHLSLLSLECLLSSVILQFICSSDVPSSPKDIGVIDIQEDSVTLQWSPPDSDGGSKLLGYVVERREVGRQQWVRVGQTAPDVRTIKARNLLEGRPYTFRVMAENAEGLSEPAMMLKAITPERPIGGFITE